MITHLIQGFASLRYVQHHHRDTKRNKIHAVKGTPSIYDGGRAETICGATVGIAEDPQIYTPTYNCWKVDGNTQGVTCKDCRKKLAEGTK